MWDKRNIFFYFFLFFFLWPCFLLYKLIFIQLSSKKNKKKVIHQKKVQKFLKRFFNCRFISENESFTKCRKGFSLFYFYYDSFQDCTGFSCQRDKANSLKSIDIWWFINHLWRHKRFILLLFSYWFIPFTPVSSDNYYTPDNLLFIFFTTTFNHKLWRAKL